MFFSRPNKINKKLDIYVLFFTEKNPPKIPTANELRVMLYPLVFSIRITDKKRLALRFCFCFAFFYHLFLSPAFHSNGKWTSSLPLKLFPDAPLLSQVCQTCGDSSSHPRVYILSQLYLPLLRVRLLKN